ITSEDSIHYHLPFAARFAATGSVTPLHFTAPGQATQFQPANGELVHGMGMILFGRDVVSPFVNLGWLSLTLLAAWCIGRRKGVGPATLLATAALLASPVMVISQAGTAESDVVALFFLLAAVALLFEARSPATFVLAGVAAGLGIGAKVTLLAPVA